MNVSAGSHSLHSFNNFGDLLKYLRRRARLTQLELSISVGYSEAQITRLEKNQRLPDLTAIKALFIPVLHLESEPQLATRFLELAESARQEDGPAPGIAPYKGLLFFEESDSELFFGREALTAHLAEHVIDLAMDSSSRFLAVVGASGSGKSSLVRAGLAVALKRAGWEVRIFTPTAKPLRISGANLDPACTNGSERVLILVDQFEEVFTLCRDEMERIAFVEKLLSAAKDKSGRIVVVIALRADFYSHCAQYPLLRQAVAAEQEYIGQMTSEELRHAIEGPAKRSSWEFEPGLVDVLLNDIGAQGAGEPEPGALPLLSHALLATWERRRGRMFTLDGYRASGGVRGAIAETAESIFTDQLNQPQQELARNVFLRLTELGEGTEDTRRRAALNELVRKSSEAAQLRAVLNTLAEARLITLNADSAEVAHEALIREWQRLHEWLTQDREGLLLHRHLTDSAHDWETRGRDPSELYRGARLAQAREWTAGNQERLNDSERTFLATSVEQEEHDTREREAQRQRELQAAHQLAETQSRTAKQLRHRAIFLTGAFGIAILFAMIASFFGNRAEANAKRAQSEQQIAVSRELAYAAISNLGDDPERSILLSLQAEKSADTLEAQNALHRSIMASRVVLVLRHDAQVWSVTFSPDGKQVATASQDKTAKIWDANTGELLLTLKGHTASVNSIVYSPDGLRIATSSDDHTAKVWDAATGKELFTLAGHTDVVHRVVFSPNGNQIATVSDRTIRVWNANTGRELLTIQSYAPTSDIAFSPNGIRLASSTIGYGEGKVILWDALTGKQLSTLSTGGIDPLTGVAFSPDGTRVAASALSVMAIVWDADTGEELTRFTGHNNHVNAIAFSPDGKWIATGSQDHTAKIWDPSTGKEVLSLSGHSYDVNHVAFSPDGKRLATASLDGTARVWDITPAKELLFIPTDSNVRTVALSPDGSRVLTDDSDNAPKVWDATSGRLLMTYGGHFDLGVITAYSPDGKFVAAVSNNGPVVIWDAQTGKERLTLPGHSDIVWGMAFSPDGTRIATAGADGFAIIWDLSNGKTIYTLYGYSGPVFGVAFSPDGKRIATANRDKTAKIWNATTGKQLLTLEGHTDLVWNVAYSPDGRLIGTASRDGTAKIWDASTGKVLWTLRGHTGIVDSVAFSPDGKLMATGSWDGTAKIWDALTGTNLLTFPVGGGVGGISFSQDGRRFAVKGGLGPGGVYVFVLPIEDLVTLAKSRVTRTLTKEECQQYLHIETCPTEP